MGFCRVLEVPAEDSVYGAYKLRIPVIPASYRGEQTAEHTICVGNAANMAVAMEDLSYYGFGDSFISLFNDLKFNNSPMGEPPNFNAGSLLHSAYPNIPFVRYDTDTVVTNTVKLYNTTLSLDSEATCTDNTVTHSYKRDYYVHWKPNSSYLLLHYIDLWWGGEDYYGAIITIYGIYDDQLNGNKFDIQDPNNACG